MDEIIKKQLIKFFSKYPLKRIKKGGIVARPGEKFAGIIFVKKGYLKAYTLSKDKRETTLPLFKPIFYFSLIAGMTGKETQHYFEAISPAEIWIAPKKEFLKFLEENKVIKDGVMEAMLAEFVGMTADLGVLMANSAGGKVAGMLVALAEKFGHKNGVGVVIKFKVTHKLLASLTGLTRETVTLQLNKLKKEGLIGNKKRDIWLKDTKRLKEVE